MPFFDGVLQAPADPIFGLLNAFQEDKRPHKVNLSVGVYKTEELKTALMHSVKKAEKTLWEEERDKEYLPIEGDPLFLDALGTLVFGKAFWSTHPIAAAQTLGGTGALHLGGAFLNQEISSQVAISDPTWPNHKGVFTHCGLQVISYPYYDRVHHKLHLDAFIDFLKTLPEKTIIVLHASCHNPTGLDPSLEEWKALSEVFLSKRLIPFFDFAYQGFKAGLEEDAAAIRLFAEAGHEMLVAASCSKNFSLYAERVGALFLCTFSPQTATRVKSVLKTLIRTRYSNPPLHGARIVSCILRSESLRKEWEEELTSMRQRIHKMRKALTEKLSSQSAHFSFLQNRAGLFSFCGLAPEKVQRLAQEYAIYMTGDGRINIAGLNQDNLDYVTHAIQTVLS